MVVTRVFSSQPLLMAALHAAAHGCNAMKQLTVSLPCSCPPLHLPVATFQQVATEAVIFLAAPPTCCLIILCWICVQSNIWLRCWPAASRAVILVIFLVILVMQAVFGDFYEKNVAFRELGAFSNYGI